MKNRNHNRTTEDLDRADEVFAEMIAEIEDLKAQNARLLALLKMVSETGGSLKNRELSEVRAAIIEAEKQPSNP